MLRIQHLFFIVLITHGTSFGKWWEKYDLSKLAVITAPIADMLTGAITAYGVNGTASELYRQLPVSCNQPGKFPCVRVFQGLFNEVFVGATCKNNECKGSFPGVIYAIDQMQNPITLFFLLQEKTLFLSDLKARGFDVGLIPCPTWIEDDQGALPSVILTLPWYDAITHTFFSAGTRFVHRPAEDTTHHYCVEFLHFVPLQVIKTFIPKARALIEQKRSSHEARDVLISIVEGWIDSIEGAISYVWGGSSVIGGCPEDEAFEFIIDEGHGVEVFARPHFHHKDITGLDCSGLVWLARRVANIHSPYRNTGMLNQFLKPITCEDRLEKGDLLWVRGHVMVIGDVEQNEIFEAAGYSSGYGKVQRIHVKDRFVGITHFGQLLKAYFAREPLVFKSLNGKHTSFKEFKLLKLM
jgi:hypothetical protein